VVWPVILTLCISALALVVSLTALGWQVASWRRSGPRVQVTSKSGFAGSEPFVSLDVTNSGRLATEISRIGFKLSKLDDLQHVAMFRDVLGDPVLRPLPLAPGATLSKLFGARDLLDILGNHEFAGTDARPSAVTGHGRVDGDLFDLRGRVEMLVATAERKA
jgi:hypothetical protein